MAVADILSTIRGFVASSSKSQTEFKNESNKNNRNVSDAVRDISRMFSSQRAVNQKNESSLADILDVSQTTSRTTQQNNDLLKESISLQNSMLQELRKLNTGVGSLISSFDSSNMSNQDSQGGIGSRALMAAGAALGLGTAALPGVLNNFYGKDVVGGHLASGEKLFGGGQNTSGNSLRVEELVNIAKEAGFNQEEAKIMAAIAASESSGNPNAHNPVGRDNSYGLWQINMLGEMGPERRAKLGIQSNEELFDPKVNAKAAYMVYKEQGFDAWSDYKNGRFMRYLPEGDDSMVYGHTKPLEGPSQGGLRADSSVTGRSGGNVLEEQGSLAAIRKGPINDKLKEVLKTAAAMAGVDVVIHSGGQPSKDSGRGPRTGSTRHDDGNAADLYLKKDGKILRDPEDRETMAKFVSAATQAGATGIGFGGEGKYMGPSSIHVGFGRPATWGGSPWIAQAASGVYNNTDLASAGGGLGGAMSDMAANAMRSLNAAFELFGLSNVNPANFLSSFFGIPLEGADIKKDEKGNETYGPSYEEEAQEGKDVSYDPISTENLKNQSSNVDSKKPAEKDDKGFITYEKFGNLADQIKEAAMAAPSPIVVAGYNPATSSNISEGEFMTDFGAAGNQPKNTRASWAPRIAVLRPDEKVTENIRWAARISPNLIT